MVSFGEGGAPSSGGDRIVVPDEGSPDADHANANVTTAGCGVDPGHRS
jgi:hypothetical protein